MTRKDARSLILSMVLGDGCLSDIKQGGKKYGLLSLDHGLKQSDYVTWKAQIVSKIFNRDVKIRQGHRGNSLQFQVCVKRLRVWRKFCYPNGKKQIARILKLIRHPEFALAIWLMDDGYVEPSLTDGKLYGARFRIFTNAEPMEEQDKIIEWFKSTLNIIPLIRQQWDKRQNKYYPFLKLTQEDSLKIWHVIREVVLSLKSMQYKFRQMEEIYQRKLLQRSLGSEMKRLELNDIVRHSEKSEITR